MKPPIIHIVLLLFIASVRANEREVICTPFDSGNEVEIHCTYKDVELNDNNNDIVLVRHLKTLKKITIECPAHYIDFMELLPKINMEKMNQVHISYCALPPQGFLSVLQGLNISETLLLSINALRPVDNKPTKINSQLFKGLQFVEYLKLINNDEIIVEDNFIKEIQELKQLDLYSNKFINLDRLNFTLVPKLKWLQMGNNNIKKIPEGFFQNLKQLKQLYLFNNNLDELRGNTFAGTENLQMIELSNNQIHTIDENIFSNMTNLVNVSFYNNNLSWFGRDIFKKNKKLFLVRLNSNPGMQMDDYALSDLPNLNNVRLDMCQIKFLPAHLFTGSVNIVEINLSGNSLEELPDDGFNDLNQVVILRLNNNKLKMVTERTFESLLSLKELYLRDNQLGKIGKYFFQNLRNLEILDLQNNKIVSISEAAFYNLTVLEELKLSHNQVRFVDSIGITPFSQCVKLRRLDLSFNGLDNWSSYYMSTSHNLEIVNVSNNNLTEIHLLELIKNVFTNVLIDFSSNQISLVEVFLPTDHNETNISIKLNIENNPLGCDCYNYDLISHLQGDLDLFNMVEFLNFRSLACHKPEGFSHMTLAEFPRKIITCPLELLVTDGGKCDENCNCFWKPYDSSFIVDCSHKNLTTLPMFKAPGGVRLDGSRTGGRINGVEVYADGNDLVEGPGEMDGYENVTKLNLSYNNINNVSWIPSSLSVLHLDHNHLTYLPQNIIEQLNASSIINVTLGSNPWICDCSTQTFQDYLFNRKNQVDSRDIRCKETDRTVIETPNLCRSKKIVILSVSIVLVLLMFFFACSFALYYKYQEEIKVWLYSKNLCLWFVTEEELDKDKVYDVFISFSHMEDKFVLKTLLPTLESGPDGFKVCMHYRDFIPGETISNQVANSVSTSRRTLVVLSNSFIESCWAKMEFRMAHTQAIREERARVIVVVYGDIDESKLDDELKAYLRTNTYIKWGDPWFWQKLTYALPHRKDRDRFSQRQANIMLNIDKKFELVTSYPPQSTPPILSLDAKLLSSYPSYMSPPKIVDVSPSDSDERLIVNS